MTTFAERVTVFCFAASYGVALALELWHLLRPRPIQRYVSIGFGLAGLLAHAIYVAVLAVALWMTMDLDRPRQGLIQVTSQPLVDTLAAMK